MNFADFQKKVIDVTNTVGKKTNDLIEEGKLLYKIREAEREIDRLYQDLGRAVYEADEDMEVSFEEYTSDKTEQIDRQKEKLAELRGKLADIKGSRVCRACGTINPNGSCYCSKCGTQL